MNQRSEKAGTSTLGSVQSYRYQSGPRRSEAVQKVMDDHTLDALVYPTWTFPPCMIGDLNTPHGNNRPRMERADVDQDCVRL
jgi:hypothetical protein